MSGIMARVTNIGAIVLMLIVRPIVECLVACDDPCTVDEDVNIAAIFDCLLVCKVHDIVVGYVYNISGYLSIFAELLFCSFDSFLVDVPDDEAFRSLLKGHPAHYLSDSGCSSCNKYICVFKFHNH